MSRTDRNAIKPVPDEDYTRDEVWPLRSIWDNEPEINEHATYRALESWASPARRVTTDFPPPAEMISRFTFYDPNTVLKWYRLWKKANKNYKKPTALIEEEKNRAKR